jgi:hypothetical protein
VVVVVVGGWVVARGGVWGEGGRVEEGVEGVVGLVGEGVFEGGAEGIEFVGGGEGEGGEAVGDVVSVGGCQ